LTEVYGRLAAWSRFWLDRRTAPGSDLPHYQHGNDSGWDNATVFDRDRVVESPDLAAFLVLQLDELARLAPEVGSNEAGFWRGERDRVQAALLSQLHDDDGFFAVGASSGERSSRTSLLTALPVLAAHRFPAEVRARLADKVAAHLTPWGLATQPPDTPEYDSDGYWRGPIWAPSTLLIEDGLRSAGFADIADTVSARFRALCERSGFAENFDALTGEGLRDRAYTWTASVYLILARDAVARGAAS
ncbi:MAG: glycogen debranching protein, partial [Microbacterium sp.]|nr:glycogen debranching protein [Microbacterium sp.]